jgi:hypothetical protein
VDDQTADQPDVTTDDQNTDQPDVTTDDQNTVDEPEEKADEVPENYSDFQMPEGIEIDTDLLGEAVPLFKELKLNQEQAQKLVDLQAKSVQKFTESQTSQRNDTIVGWENDIKADKDIGGDNFDQNLSIAKEAVDKFGTPELTKFLADSGAGSHPEIVRMFVKIGNLTREDNPNGGSPTAQSTDIVKRLYPNN